MCVNATHITECAAAVSEAEEGQNETKAANRQQQQSLKPIAATSVCVCVRGIKYKWKCTSNGYWLRQSYVLHSFYIPK